MACPVPGGGRPLPTSEVKPLEGPSGKSRDPPREEEKEKKKKKHKKRSRTRSRSPKCHSSSKSRSRSHPKAKHCLPSAYRTARRSRCVCVCVRTCVWGGARACAPTEMHPSGPSDSSSKCLLPFTYLSKAHEHCQAF